MSGSPGTPQHDFDRAPCPHPGCDCQNSCEARYCARCGRPLAEDAAVRPDGGVAPRNAAFAFRLATTFALTIAVVALVSHGNAFALFGLVASISLAVISYPAMHRYYKQSRKGAAPLHRDGVERQQ